MIPCALRTFFCAPCVQICTLRTLRCAFRTLRLRSPYIALALSVLFALFVHRAFGDCAVRTPKFRPVWNHLSLLRVVRYVSPDVLALIFFKFDKILNFLQSFLFCALFVCFRYVTSKFLVVVISFNPTKKAC